MSHPIQDVFPSELLDSLETVEERLATNIRSRQEDLDQWCKETIHAGGKRIRPLLLLTSFWAAGGRDKGDEAWQQALDAATSIELVHTASLVHDDIMDEAPQRRGKPSTYAAHGRDGAILVGDYLFTQAFALAASLPKDAMEMTADACRRLCEGQLREQALHAMKAPSEADYHAVIRDKTSSLLAASCGIGATMAGADEKQVAALYRYGETLGNAFQILDDVLDVIGDPQWTGKPAGTDYLQGTHGAPYLKHAQAGGEFPAQRNEADFPKIRGQLLDSGAVAASQLDAAAHTQDALLSLQTLPESPARRALETLATHLMERTQ